MLIATVIGYHKGTMALELEIPGHGCVFVDHFYNTYKNGDTVMVEQSSNGWKLYG